MKKILMVLLGLLLVSGIIGCQKTTTTKTQAGGTTTTQGNEDAEITFEGVESKKVAWGSKFDALEGVSAKDVDGTDITANIQVSGEIDTFQSHEQEIVYTVTGKDGETAHVLRKITVNFATDEDMLAVSQSTDPTVVREVEMGAANWYNADFSVNGKAGWGCWGTGVVDYNVNDGVMEFKTSTEYAQISKNGNYLIPDQYYFFLFEAKADKLHEDKTVEYTFRAIYGDETQGAWHENSIKYWKKSITTEWDTFGFLFKAKTADENVLCLISNGLDNTIYFKNLRLFEVQPKAGQEIVIPEGATPTNYDLSTDDATFWDSFGDDGSFTVEQNKLTINPNQTYYQVANHRNKFEVGKTYTLEFDIKSNVNIAGNGNKDAFSYKVIVGSEETGWTIDNDLYPTVDLVAGETSHIKLAFTIKYETKNVFAYIFDGVVGAVEISNITVTKGDHTNDPVDPSNKINGEWVVGWPGTGSFVEEEGTIKFTKTKPEYEVVQISNNTLVNGAKYTLSFDLKSPVALTSADAATYNFRVVFGSEEAGWNNKEYYPNVNVAANEVTHFELTVDCLGETKNCILFCFERCEGTFEISNVRLEYNLPKEEETENLLNGRWYTGWPGFGNTYADGTVTFTKNEGGYQVVQCNQIKDLTIGAKYIVTFDILSNKDLTSADAATYNFRVVFGTEEVVNVWNDREYYPDVNIAAGVKTTITIEVEALGVNQNCLLFCFERTDAEVQLSNVKFYAKEDATEKNILSGEWALGWPYTGSFKLSNDTLVTFEKNETGYQVVQNGFNVFEVGKKYVVKFAIKSSVALTSNDGATYTYRVTTGSEEDWGATNRDHYTEIDVAANDWTEVEVEFECYAATLNCILFCFDKVAADIQITNVIVVEAE